ncbi:hypothetical protein [Cylindrospermopsis raciborskii]|uniref:hypothetical protein n=1 Tax=Cylindrospermopsis raciborskii TaxID=77022 RepID=UPI0026EAE0A2|nr:hypothetical protein [Cylindrospermopsis raciborskii]
MDPGVIEQFLPEQEIDECGTGRRKPNIFIRVMRKKYKCLIIFLLLSITMFQTFALLLSKIEGLDYKTLKSLFINVVEDIGGTIVNNTDKALQNTLILELFNRYLEITTNSSVLMSEMDVVP